MKSFEWNRFRKMLLWTFENTKGEMLRMGIIMAIVFFLCEEFVLSILTFSAGGRVNVDPGIVMPLGVSCFMLGFICLYFGASTMFANIRHKKQAISFLMHPASNPEKYLSRWTYVTIGWPVVLIVSFFAADYFRVLFNMLVGWGATTSFISMLCDNAVFGGGNLMQLISNSSPAIVEIIISILAMMWTHSFYILGSAFFRRHPFILTSLVLMAIQICIAVAGDAGLLRHTDDFALDEAGRYAVIAVGLALMALNYWASYRLFKRTNVINNKWINL